MDQMSMAEENLIIFFFPLIAHASLKFLLKHRGAQQK